VFLGGKYELIHYRGNTSQVNVTGRYWKWRWKDYRIGTARRATSAE